MSLKEFVETNHPSLVYGFAAEQEFWNIRAKEFGANWKKPLSFEGYCRDVYEGYERMVSKELTICSNCDEEVEMVPNGHFCPMCYC